MKKLTLVLALVLGSSMAQASFFNNEVDAQEASNALVHCAEEAKSLLTSEIAYLGDVVGQHAKVSARVSTKTIVFQSLEGGYFGGPAAEVVAQLTVTATVTQPSISGMPSEVVYSCQLSK